MLMAVRPARRKSRKNAVKTAVTARKIGIVVATKLRNRTSRRIDADENADELLRALLNGRELGVAVELRGDPCRRDRVAHRVLDRDHRIAILVVDHLVELRLRVADAPVVGNRAVGERIARRSRCRPCRSVGVVLRVFSLASAFSMAALRSGVSSCSPGGAAKTMFKTPPCSEANCDSIRSVAFCVSEPGISNWSRRLPPKRTSADEEREEGQRRRRASRARLRSRTYAPTGRGAG